MEKVIYTVLVLVAVGVISLIPFLFQPMRDNAAIVLSLAPFMALNGLALTLVGKDFFAGLAERNAQKFHRR